MGGIVWGEQEQQPSNAVWQLCLPVLQMISLQASSTHASSASRRFALKPPSNLASRLPHPPIIHGASWAAVGHPDLHHLLMSCLTHSRQPFILSCPTRGAAGPLGQPGLHKLAGAVLRRRRAPLYRSQHGCRAPQRFQDGPCRTQGPCWRSLRRGGLGAARCPCPAAALLPAGLQQCAGAAGKGDCRPGERWRHAVACCDVLWRAAVCCGCCCCAGGLCCCDAHAACNLNLKLPAGLYGCCNQTAPAPLYNCAIPVLPVSLQMLVAVLLAVAAAGLIGSLSLKGDWGGGGEPMQGRRSRSTVLKEARVRMALCRAPMRKQHVGHWATAGIHPGLCPPVHHPVPLLLCAAADYASYVLLLLSAACSLTHLAIGACVYLAAAGRPPRSFFRLLLSFEPLVGCCCVHSRALCRYIACALFAWLLQPTTTPLIDTLNGYRRSHAHPTPLATHAHCSAVWTPSYRLAPAWPPSSLHSPSCLPACWRLLSTPRGCGATPCAMAPPLHRCGDMLQHVAVVDMRWLFSCLCMPGRGVSPAALHGPLACDRVACMAGMLGHGHTGRCGDKVNEAGKRQPSYPAIPPALLCRSPSSSWRWPPSTTSPPTWQAAGCCAARTSESRGAAAGL